MDAEKIAREIVETAQNAGHLPITWAKDKSEFVIEWRWGRLLIGIDHADGVGYCFAKDGKAQAGSVDLMDEMEKASTEINEALARIHSNLATHIAQGIAAALATARREALEQAAQYLEQCDDPGDRQKAATIRALEPKP